MPAHLALALEVALVAFVKQYEMSEPMRRAYER